MGNKLSTNVGSCLYSDVQKYLWFYGGIVKGKQLFPLCGQNIPSIMIPGDFFVPFKVNIPEEVIIARLVDCAFDEVVQRVYTQERNALRSEKVRPWGLRTYRPFRGQLQDAKPSFSEMLRIAEAVIDEIGMPMSPKSRGRRRKYEWKQILAVILCKGVQSFHDLERVLRDTGYCKTDGRTPCDSELHYVYSQIPEEWLDKALQYQDDKVTVLYAKFDKFLNEFVIDGTGIPCDSLVVRVAALQKQLAKETEEITILTRLITNTVRAISSHTNKISALSASLEPGSIIYADPEYDVKENYSDAEWGKLDILVKPRDVAAKSALRGSYME